jgi:hypothetical protein
MYDQYQHHHHQGLDSSQVANTALGVYAGARAAQGDWTPLIAFALIGGGFSTITGLIVPVLIIAVAIGALVGGCYILFYSVVTLARLLAALFRLVRWLALSRGVTTIGGWILRLLAALPPWGTFSIAAMLILDGLLLLLV